jgi:hypothetical protein
MMGEPDRMTSQASDTGATRRLDRWPPGIPQHQRAISNQRDRAWQIDRFLCPC